MMRTPIFDELYAKYVVGTPARDGAASPPVPSPQVPWQDQVVPQYTGRHQTPEWPAGD
ncbi:hypothetical protein [Lentzea sp. NPDC060358]|uniref:hypothetical protein n=1 Tax=Lentzea sp. NPDC060358 TaxID=3347103 RepID=UPI00364EA7FF